MYSQADKAAKYKILNTGQYSNSRFIQNKLFRVATCALCLSEKYWQFLLKTVRNEPFYLKEKILKLF